MDRKSLLVVDDEAQICQLLSQALAPKYDVLTAQSGEDAIKKAVLNRPSCILLDVMIPQMDGFMVCEILKSLRQTKLIPIILISAKPRLAVWPTAQRMGVSDYVEKPFKIDQIHDSLTSILEASPLDRRRAPRVPMKIPVLVRGKDVLGYQFEVRSETEDVSRGGALVHLPVRVPIGEQVEIHRSSTPAPKGFAILTLARVAWNDEADREGPCLHGLEFLNPSPEWVIVQ